jgi:hypothetical protein
LGLRTAHDIFCLLRIITPSMIAWPPTFDFLTTSSRAIEKLIKGRIIGFVFINKAEFNKRIGRFPPPRLNSGTG